MKLRYIFTALTAAALAFVGCQEEERFLDEVQVSQSVVAIPVEGGQVEVTVEANDAWEFAGMPEWLTATPASGAAGSTKVVFSAEAADETRDAVFYLNIGEVQQVMNALQMAEKVELQPTSCADVLSANAVGTVYKVKGTITDLTNYDKYGCFYVNDGTAEVYVYGSMNPTQFKPEVGDIITFEGPWTSYGNFDDVTIVGLEKSFIKLEKTISTPLSHEGGVATVLLTVKDGEFVVEIPEDAAWLTASEPSSVGGLTCVELTATANDGGVRSAKVTFKTTVNDVEYFTVANIEQLGAITAVTVAEFIAKEEDGKLYQLTGKVTKISSAYSSKYGNMSFNIMDATGEVSVYRMACPESAAEIEVGDIVTVYGVRASYNESPQMGEGCTYVSHIHAAPVTIADFLAAEVNSDKWYKLTGKIEEIVKGEYGNIYLADETARVYVYGITTAPVAKNDKTFQSLELAQGDVITIIGTRAQYPGAADPNQVEQVGGPAYFVTKVVEE